MSKRLRPMVIGTLLLALFCEGTLFTQATSDHPADKSDVAQGVLRLHVIANSDSERDQQVKLMVRDALIEVFQPAKSLEEAEQMLLDHGAEMLALVEGVLSEQGFDYGAQLMLGKYPFPDRTYGETFYPAGDYQALRVILGSGQGQNWWCVLFPPLCLMDVFGYNAKMNLEQDVPGDTIEFESIFVKLIQQWRGSTP